MSARLLGAKPRKEVPDLSISMTAFSWYGTEAITRSGWTAIICSALAVQESARMARGCAVISGTTSTQYFVQATTRSSSPRAARMTVALGCKHAMRRGEWDEGINFARPHSIKLSRAYQSPQENKFASHVPGPQTQDRDSDSPQLHV